MDFFSIRIDRRDKDAWTYQGQGLNGEMLVRPNGECYGFVYDSDLGDRSDLALRFVKGYLNRRVDVAHGGLILVIMSNDQLLKPQMIAIPRLTWHLSSEGQWALPNSDTNKFEECGTARVTLVPVHGDEYARRKIDTTWAKLNQAPHQELLAQCAEFQHVLEEMIHISEKAEALVAKNFLEIHD